MPCDRVWLAVISASRHKHQALNLAASLEENLVEDPSDRRRPLRLVDRLATSDDALGDPESRLLVREQLDSMLHTLPTLTATERAALSGGLSGHTNRQLADVLKITPKAASQAGYRARRKLTAALSRPA
jgi:DNA-directed RNA polymerase specialized sigma24 family protein